MELTTPIPWDPLRSLLNNVQHLVEHVSRGNAKRDAESLEGMRRFRGPAVGLPNAGGGRCGRLGMRGRSKRLVRGRQNGREWRLRWQGR